MIKETLLLAWLMPQGMVISLKMMVTEMGYRGSKSVIFEMIIVKEQRVDGSSIKLMVRCTLVARKAGSQEKLSNLRLKISQ